MGKKMFKIGDQVVTLENIKKRASGVSPSPLFRTQEVKEIREFLHHHTYYIQEEHSLHTEETMHKDTELVHKEDIRRVALEYLSDCILDVSQA